MDEVSCHTLGVVFDALEERGICTDRVFEGLSLDIEALRDSRRRIDWALFAEIAERTCEACGGVLVAEEIGAAHFATPSFASFRRIASGLVRPRDVYWLAAKWFGRSLLSVVEIDFHELAGGRLRISLEIPEPYRFCLPLLHAIRGALRVMPRALGLADAEVGMLLEGRRARYDVDLPPSDAERRAPENGASFSEGEGLESALAELDRQQTRIEEQYRRLCDANRRIEQQAAELERAVGIGRDLARDLRQLEYRSEERVRSLTAANKELLGEVASRARYRKEPAPSPPSTAEERLATAATLARGIAHELNNPIGSILVAAEFAQASRNQDDWESIAWRSLDEIRALAQRSGAVVDDVLRFATDVSRPKVRVDVSITIDRAINRLRAEVRSYGTRIQLDTSRSCFALVNEPQIEEVLVNLLRNAIEAGGPGSSVSIRAETLGDTVRVRVADEGEGISSSERARIFDPFYTTKKLKNARGLGLTVVLAHVLEHEGSIDLQSDPGRGTVVTLELPAVRLR